VYAFNPAHPNQDGFGAEFCRINKPGIREEHGPPG
jgi:hypothetical protein